MTSENGDSPVIIQPSWDEYAYLIEVMFGRVESEFEPNFIVGIANGGLFPAVITAKYFKVPMATLAARSYSQSDGAGFSDRKGEVKVGSSLALIDSHLHGNVLLVDDLTDSGATLEYCRDWIWRQGRDTVTDIKTAVMWHKTGSVFTPNFCAVAVEPDTNGEYPWIDQPHEKYERMKK